MSAYRVVQEALTNALKYADGPVRLRVASDPRRLRISCANPVGTARANGSGLGLQGMLGATTRVQAVVLAYENGLVRPGGG